MELNNIVKIEYADARLVSGQVVQETLTECSLMTDTIKWMEVEGLKVPARMTSESEIRDKDVLDRTELVFRTCENLGIKSSVCFRLTLRNGKQVLVNDGKRPHGVLLYRFVHPDNVADSQLREYSFRRVAKVGPMMLK